MRVWWQRLIVVYRKIILISRKWKLINFHSISILRLQENRNLIFPPNRPFLDFFFCLEKRIQKHLVEYFSQQSNKKNTKNKRSGEEKQTKTWDESSFNLFWACLSPGSSQSSTSDFTGTIFRHRFPYSADVPPQLITSTIAVLTNETSWIKPQKPQLRECHSWIPLSLTRVTSRI